MTAKEQIRQMLDELPDSNSREGLLYQLYVQHEIAMGMKAVDEGRTVSDEEARREFLK